ncbi:hypothetical protein QYF36_007175 [Acer negundo]|nr:hypothetical protein QYF36_007175 [Acer negundo]
MLMFEEGVEIGEQGIGIARREGTGRKMLRYKTSRSSTAYPKYSRLKKSMPALIPERHTKGASAGFLAINPGGFPAGGDSLLSFRHNLQLFLECR